MSMNRILALSLSALMVSACNQKAEFMKAKPAELNIPATSSASYGLATSEVIAEDANATASNIGNQNGSYAGTVAPPIGTEPLTPHRVETKIPTQIIKNADVRMQVDKLDKSYIKIKTLLAKHSAYFGNDNRSQSDYEITQDMLIRVPSAQFDSLLDELMGEAIYINNKNISAEDVTGQFVDIEARLKTKKEVELRYLTLLKEAKKVSDILEVENNLRTIREEIEAQEGRLKLLRDQVSYSTIHLSAYQTLEFKAKPSTSFFSQVAESLSNGWIGLRGVVIGLISIWPLYIIIAFVFWSIKKWRSRKK